LNVTDTFSRRVRRMNFVGPVQLTPMQETEAFREGDGVKAARIQRPTPFWGALLQQVPSKTAITILQPRRLKLLGKKE